MTHCFASCCSLINSSFAFAVPAAKAAAAPKQVVVSKRRIMLPPFDVVGGRVVREAKECRAPAQSIRKSLRQRVTATAGHEALSSRCARLTFEGYASAP